MRPPTKIFIYIGIVIKTVTWIILSILHSNGVPFSKRSHVWEPFGYCRRKMILSAYGFLKKLNQEPILMTDKVRSTGLKGFFFFGLLCASSADAIHDRNTALTSILCRRSRYNVTMVPMSSRNASMVQEKGFKFAENIDPSEYPDAFTDCDSMPFFSIFSDEDWDMFLKTPIIKNNAPDYAIFPEEEPYVPSLETKVVLETIMANMKETGTEKEAFAFLPERNLNSEWIIVLPIMCVPTLICSLGKLLRLLILESEE